MPENRDVRPRQPRTPVTRTSSHAPTRARKSAEKQANSAGAAVGGVAEQLTVHWLPVQSITDSQRNPRHKLGGIDELASSLDAHGMLQPVIVRTVDDRYELVAGHRRFRAAQQLGWRQIPAIIRSESENDAYVLTLVENLQREDLSPREEAEALEVLVRDRGWSTRQVASAIGRSQAFVSKRLRVFEDPILAPAVLHNQVSVSAAEELLTASERERYDLLARAIAGGWDRAQVRRSIHEKSTRAPSQRRAVGRRAHELRMQLRLVRPEDLTEAERRELRALFQELSMLARARPGAPRVFPPLPAARKR